MIYNRNYDDVVRNLNEEFPDFKIVPKSESSFMRLINFLLLCVTFGKQSKFMERYTTTIGYTVYTPANWGDYNSLSKAQILRHERVHMLQQKRHGRFMFTFLYLCWPLPMFLSLSRAKFEMEAYEESMRVSFEELGEAGLESMRESVINQFTSGAYGWMWPFRKQIETWYANTSKKIIIEGWRS